MKPLFCSLSRLSVAAALLILLVASARAVDTKSVEWLDGRTYNFSPWPMIKFALRDAQGRYLGGGDGGNMPRRSPSAPVFGDTMRSTPLPVLWQPGVKYTLFWQVQKRSKYDPIVRGVPWWPLWYSAEVEFPPYYGNPSHYEIFFFEGEKVCLKLIADGNTTRAECPQALRVAPDDPLNPIDPYDPPDPSRPYDPGPAFRMVPAGPYVATGTLNDDANAGEAERWAYMDVELMERRRKTARVFEWISKKYGKEAGKVVTLLDLVETEEWFMANRPSETEYGQNESKKSLEKFRLELKELEAGYGRSAKSLIHADSVQEAKPERELLEKEK